MVISPQILDYLSRGWQVAAELPTKDVVQRAYIVVIPQVPNPHKNPEIWTKKSKDIRPGKAVLSSPEIIQGYEIRYLQHHFKYTDTDWGWDYDYVLEDKSTRVRRVFVINQEEIESRLAEFLPDSSKLELAENFDSSLVCSPITAYLDDDPQDYPHLWE
jgi:hypothetical protein